MAAYRKPLTLAAGTILIALLAVFEIVPAPVAQVAPVALLALFPAARVGGCGQRVEA